MEKLGIIQSRGLGDIIIALPIARFYSERGAKVYWPIDRRFLPSFQNAVDYVDFIPFDFKPTLEGFAMGPMRLLKERGCETIIPLYSHLSGTNVPDQGLAGSLKFDEYKYAISGVPFSEKWNLLLTRDPAREEALFKRIVKREPYIVRHLSGSDFSLSLPVPAEYSSHQVIDITESTDNILDWLLVLEKASALFLIDSCYANLVEQLGIDVPKTLILRSKVPFTPVYKNGWNFGSVPLGGQHSTIGTAVGRDAQR